MFDAYTLRARVQPAGMVLIPPLTFAAGAFTSEPIETASPLGLILFVLGTIGALIARARGRRLQPDLWLAWGGSPTVRRLRWRDSDDPAKTARLHTRIQQHVDAPLPTADEERGDHDAADETYDEAIGELRELTRGADFPLVADANADYGFRRNLLGLRPIGLVVALASTALSGYLLAAGGETLLVVPLLVGGISSILWATVVRPSWVRTAAEDYADRLLGAVKLL